MDVFRCTTEMGFPDDLYEHFCIVLYKVIVSMFLMLQHKGSASVYQVWYDDVKSLRIKYKLAERMNLRGVGMWYGDALDYKDTQEGRQERADMWGALPDRK